MGLAGRSFSRNHTIGVHPMTENVEKRTMNRWFVVVGAVMIMFALGAIYAWSAFTVPLQGKTGTPSEFDFTKTQTNLIFSAGLASFGIVMIIAGRLQQKFKPRWIAMVGGVLLGLGYILAGLTGTAFIWKLLLIGVLGGAGIGFAYVVPIAIGVKWFPDKKGLISGLAVAGFGFGAFLWILLANPPSIIGINGLIRTEMVEGVSTYTADNINTVFLIYGIAFLILVVLGSLVMVNPPEGYKPKNWNPPEAKPGAKRSGIDAGPLGMLRTWQFYALWSMFMVGALAGLMVIGNIKNFAQNVDQGFEHYGFSPTQAEDYAVIGAAICLPILNGLGRIVWGMVSDRIGRKPAFIVMFASQFLLMGFLILTPASVIAFFLATAAIGFNFGGNFSLFPAITADYYGSKNTGPNYGIMFTSYAAGGIIGPLLAGWVQDNGWSFTFAFLPAAVLCLLAACVALLIKAPAPRQE